MFLLTGVHHEENDLVENLQEQIRLRDQINEMNEHMIEGLQEQIRVLESRHEIMEHILQNERAQNEQYAKIYNRVLYGEIFQSQS